MDTDRWLLIHRSQRGQMSCHRDRYGSVGSAPAAGVDAGLCELLAVLLWFLVGQGGEEAQGDRIPLFREQKQQEPQADDAGGCQTHNTEDDLMLQHVNSYSIRKHVLVKQKHVA